MLDGCNKPGNEECLNGGVCNKGTGMCKCVEGYDGDKCQTCK